jgi:D-hexose-6-phosphate mutarotase
MTHSIADLQKYEIPGRVAIGPGKGGLARVVVTTPASTAEIYLHGAHLAHFQKRGEPPLLFMSAKSLFADGQPIRGGVPICYPWFGGRAGAPSHGVARIVEWDLVETTSRPDGSVVVRLALPGIDALDDWRTLHTEFVVTVSDALTMALVTRDPGTAERRFENCLHTYFHVGDIDAVTVTGLERAPFDDFAFAASGARRVDDETALRIFQETNRVYPDNTNPVEVHDRSVGRVIRVEKSGSRSTVVWNPWTTQKMPDDFDPVEFRQMVCVESGNVKQNTAVLRPGESTSLVVTLSSRRAD